MRLTIIPIDGNVSVDNQVFVNLDLSSCNIPNDIHAFQWYETEGELEFIDNPDRTKPMNQIITVLPNWANACVDLWNQAKAEEIRIIEESRIASELAENKTE